MKNMLFDFSKILFVLVFMISPSLLSFFACEAASPESVTSNSTLRPPRPNPWRETTNWEPSSLSYIVYIWSTALFVISYYVKQQDQVHNRLTQSTNVNKNMYMYLALLSLPYLIGQIFYGFFMTPWLLLSGKVSNFLVDLYFPYRIIFPITDQMIQYGKGMSRSESKKTLVVLVSIILDIILVMALIALLILNLSIFRFFLAATIICLLYFGYRMFKSRWNLTWNNLRTKLYLGKYALILLPIVFILLELSALSFLEVLHIYLPIYLFLSQIWIIKSFGTSE